MNTPSSSNYSLMSPDGIIYLLFRRKWLILFGILLGGGAAAAVWFLAPTTYVSEAKLLVRYVTDNVSMDPSAEGGGIMRPDSRGGTIMNSEAQILTSRDLALTVVRDLGVETIFPPEQRKPPMGDVQAAAVLLRNLTVGVPGNSSVIYLAYQSHDPATAQRVLERMIAAYLEKHKEIHTFAASHDFFSRRSDQLKADLRTTEQELLNLKNEQGVVSLDESKIAVMARLELIRDRIRQEDGNLASAKARAQLLREQLGEVPAEIAAEAAEIDPVLEAERREIEIARQQLTQLRQRELTILSSYTPDSTPARNIRAQIEDAEKRSRWGETEGTAALLPAMAAAGIDPASILRNELVMEQSRIVSSEALLEVLALQEQKARDDLQRLNNSESRIVHLERQRDVQEAAYKRFADALDTASSQLALAPDQLSNIHEVQTASMPVQANRKDVMKIAGMAGAGGLGVGVGLAVLLELLGGRSLRRPTEIERALEVPTLITLPFSRAFRKPVQVAKDRKLLPAGDAKKDPSAPPEIPPEPKRTLAGPLQEYFEALTHRVESSGVFNGEIPHLIGVASCGNGAGATTVASGLAMTLSAQDAAKVLLIDGNLGGGNAHHILGIESANTLPQLLLEGQGRTSKVQDGLYLLTSGNGDHKLVRPSLGRRFRNLVGFLKQGKFTSVVVDLPPITETSPTLQMAGLLDGIILVVESEKTSRERARVALKMLHDANANVLGVVFNKKRDYVPEWLDQNG